MRTALWSLAQGLLAGLIASFLIYWVMPWLSEL